MIEFYIGTTEYNLSTVLKAIFNEDSVSITRYHVDSGEHHLAVSGTWKTYERVQALPNNTYFSLEHFEDDKVLNFPLLEDPRQLKLEFPKVEESKKVFTPFDAPEWHMFLQEEAHKRGMSFTQLMQKLQTINSEEFDILQETFLHKFYKTNG